MTQLKILLVEDNPDHAELTRRSLSSEQEENFIHWAKDGQEAVDFLLRAGEFSGAPRPGLIILDIRLPKMTGIEVLKKIKEDQELRVIPVVMLTTSDREEEALECYRMGANSYIRKPVKFSEFSEKIKSLKQYWLKTNRGPNGDK